MSKNVRFRSKCEWGININSKQNQRLNGIYQEIAEEVGIDVAEVIFKKYGGLQITFPNKFEDPSSVHEVIYEEYRNGENVQRLAKKYGYSERYLRIILKKFR